DISRRTGNGPPRLLSVHTPGTANHEFAASPAADENRAVPRFYQHGTDVSPAFGVGVGPAPSPVISRSKVSGPDIARRFAGHVLD
ncbi:MAG TPA: hypothetical protein PLF51_13440, partial [Candidatus Hydrogenedentes bacterium]|nr:hypothetical protein [Candidatus Hydrogenedentota bacterium]